MNENVKKMIQEANTIGLLATSPMEILPLLDGAEVKADICPVCHASTHLEHVSGFKECPSCNSTFKVFNGKAYMIVNNNNLENLTVNELMLRNMGINRRY